MKKILFIVFTLALFSSACVKKLVVNPDETIDLTLDTVYIKVGDSQQIVPLNYRPELLNWASADTSVLFISETGFATAKKSGQSLITVNTKSNTGKATCLIIVKPAAIPIPPKDSVSAPVGQGHIIQLPGLASDVAIGGPDSTIYVIGTDDVSPTGGFGIYRVVGGVMVKMPECAGVRIAVAPDGTPWVVNKSHLIYRYNGRLWDLMPGTANDIGIGADGSVFIIGTNDVSPTGGYDILKWDGSSWNALLNCAGTRIAVMPDGTPWVVNKSGIVYQKTATDLWEPVPGVQANDIAISASYGSVSVTGRDSGTSLTPIYGLSFGPTWHIQPQGAYGESLALTPHGLAVWVDKDHKLFIQKL